MRKTKKGNPTEADRQGSLSWPVAAPVVWMAVAEHFTRAPCPEGSNPTGARSQDGDGLADPPSPAEIPVEGLSRDEADVHRFIMWMASQGLMAWPRATEEQRRAADAWEEARDRRLGLGPVSQEFFRLVMETPYPTLLAIAAECKKLRKKRGGGRRRSGSPS